MPRISATATLDTAEDPKNTTAGRKLLSLSGMGYSAVGANLFVTRATGTSGPPNSTF